MKRVLYVQYTNPANYPPLENSSALIAQAGAEVVFSEIESPRAVQLHMRRHPRIAHRRLGRGGALGYPAYMAATIATAMSFRPDWCYASDYISAPVALAIRALTGCKVIYHEHDFHEAAGSPLTRLALKARQKLIRAADVLVVPNARRRELLGADGGRAFVAWNCPGLHEIGNPSSQDQPDVTLVYAGSLSPDRLPLTWIEALAKLPDNVKLQVYGYQTQGFPDYVDQMHARADQLSVRNRVNYGGAIDRSVLMSKLSEYSIGIASVNPRSTDLNLSDLVGASCKAFDYLSAGLPVIVSNTPAWVDTFASKGYGTPCDPTNVENITVAVSELLDRERRKAAGAAGRDRVLREWNYDTQFAPVMKAMQ